MANREIFHYDRPVVLLGGGHVEPGRLQELLCEGYPLVAADGGANHLIDTGTVPNLIVGDLDSLIEQQVWESKTKVVRITEQDTTDFEKCLYSISAPIYLALGFTGNRLDHTLAALNVAAKYIEQKSIVIVAEHDVVIVCRGNYTTTLAVGMRFSLFPLERIRFTRSAGLLYPLDGITMFPTGMTVHPTRYWSPAFMSKLHQAARVYMP